MTESQVPFIPVEEGEPVPPPPWRVFSARGFRRLWFAQVTSSLGDWIGIIAILSIAARVSNGSGAAISLVMGARLLPGFILAPLSGALIDRWDRRKVMVVCDLGRGALLALLPFFDNLLGLVVVSLFLELFTSFWAPAKDASVPKLVPKEQITSANSLGMVAAYGTFPLGGLVFASLAGLATALGRVDALHGLGVNQELLAIWVDALTYVISALCIVGLPIATSDRKNGRHVDWKETYRDVVEGWRFIRSHTLVRGIMIGLGAGLIGGGAMIPLGPDFATRVLRGGPDAFGLLMTFLGIGGALGVIVVLWLQRWIPRETTFWLAVCWCGVAIIGTASASSLAPAALAVAFVGAFAGTAYVTGFSIIQSDVEDELRGRTFATLYTVVRVCVLFSLTAAPLFADFFQWLSGEVLNNRQLEIGSVVYSLPGVRITLWAGGFITMLAGLVASREIERGHREEDAL